MLTFNTDNMVAQEFPFPAPIMDYMFNNLTASQLLKLYKTCKFFYAKFRLNIIEDFEISGSKEEERMDGNSLAILQRNPSYPKLGNLWISKSFSYTKYFDDEHPLELEYEKFSRLTYNTLRLHGEKFTAKDYEFLVKPPTLQHLIINGAIHNPETKQTLSVEECLERASHASAVDLSREDRPENFPAIDMKKLLAMERQTKLKLLHLCGISKIPDALHVIEFFKKHAIPNIDYYFGFDEDDDEYDEGNVKRFYSTIDDGIRAWKLSLTMPPAITSSFIDLMGKTAVITGASDGIGRATVILFRQLGASVIAISRNQFRLKTLVDECQDFENTGFLHTVWASPSIDRNNIEDIFERIIYRFGSKYDIFVNIADTFGWGGIPDAEEERDYCHDENTIVESHSIFLKEAKEYLENSKGCIINVPYSDEFITKPEDASVVDYKQKIKLLEEMLTLSGVRINSVNSGSPVTALPRPSGMTDIEYKKLLQNSKKTHDEQAANAIAFLASDAAKLIISSTLNVNPMNLR